MTTPIAVYVQDGDSIDYTPVADLAIGSVVDLGTFVGINTHFIPANTKGALVIEGAFDVNKFAGDVIILGAPIYWDQGTLTATGQVGLSEAVMGVAIKAAAAADPTVRVLIFPNTP